MNDKTRRKISFIIMLFAAPALGAGLNASVEAANASVTITPASVFTVQNDLAWAQHRITRLENRRDYLHRYIEKMRAAYRAPTPTSPTPPSRPTTSSPTPPTTTYTATGGWSDELRAVGFPESAIPHMLYIINRESGGCPTAVYGHGCDGSGYAVAGGPACGLTQIYKCPGPQALDPMTNLRYALQKYEASGFAPWGG